MLLGDRMKELEKILASARRIEEHRTVEAEKEIRKTYKNVLNSLREFVGVEYAKLAEDDALTYEILQRNGEYARFLDEIEQRINDITPAVSAEIRALTEQMYELAYTGMVDAVTKAVDSEQLAEELKGLRTVTPEVIKKAVENPISGLTLKDTLEKHRKEIIYDIKRNIGVGLANGDRMSTMAKRIKESVDGDYKKAIRIARTEVHRVREAGHSEAAIEINASLKQGVSGMVMMKTWKTMRDSRVRKPKGKNKADHVKLDGVQIPVDEEFDLGHGVKAKEPSGSGDAGNDINCRCYLSYDLVEMEQEAPKTSDSPMGDSFLSYDDVTKFEYREAVGKFNDRILASHPEVLGNREVVLENIEADWRRNYGLQYDIAKIDDSIKAYDSWEEFSKLSYQEQTMSAYPTLKTYTEYILRTKADEFAEEGSLLEGFKRYDLGATPLGYGKGHGTRIEFDKKYGISEFIDNNPDMQYNGGTLYRGMKVTAKDRKALDTALKTGDTIDMRGVSSWTTYSHIADDFAHNSLQGKTNKNLVIFIDETKGTRKAMMFPYSSKHLTPQFEVIQSGSCRFKVTGIEEKDGIAYVRVEQDK